MEKKEKKTEVKMEKTENKNSKCSDKFCPIHGGLKTHGRVFQGTVIRKFPTRVAIEFERTVYVPKYERYEKKKTRLHARLPSCMANDVEIGDYIKIDGCRPLSKIIHFVVKGVITKGEKKEK